MNAPDALTFPCSFPVKALTRTEDGALESVLAVVLGPGTGTAGERVRVQPSRNGRFQSVTITVQARSRAHLEAIYRELAALDVVVLTL